MMVQWCSFLFFLAILSSRTVTSQTFKPANIVAALDAAVFLENFKRGAEMAGLLDILSSPDFQGTVFAPSDMGMQAFLSGNGLTFEELAADREVFREFIALHIVPEIRLFPLNTLRQDMQLNTLASESAKLYVDRSVPSLVHIWATPKDKRDVDSTNFATILQWQDIQGEKAILYSIDNPLVPPALARNLQKTEALQGP